MGQKAGVRYELKVSTIAPLKGSAVSLGPTELIIVLLIVMLLFGAARLPKLAKSLGESAREFRKGVNEIEAMHEEKKTAD